MRGPKAVQDDQRREWLLWILYAAELNEISPVTAFEAVRNSIVGSAVPPTEREATELFRIERFDDHLPSTEDWEAGEAGVETVVRFIADNKARIDEVIRVASPRWRIDRMPPIDRSLLRIGVAEFIGGRKPHPKSTLNGLVEVAKRYGEESSPRFVNGILDQIRRNLQLPFA